MNEAQCLELIRAPYPGSGRYKAPPFFTTEVYGSVATLFTLSLCPPLRGVGEGNVFGVINPCKPYLEFRHSTIGFNPQTPCLEFLVDRGAR